MTGQSVISDFTRTALVDFHHRLVPVILSAAKNDRHNVRHELWQSIMVVPWLSELLQNPFPGVMMTLS